MLGKVYFVLVVFCSFPLWAQDPCPQPANKGTKLPTPEIISQLVKGSEQIEINTENVEAGTNLIVCLNGRPISPTVTTKSARVSAKLGKDMKLLDSDRVSVQFMKNDEYGPAFNAAPVGVVDFRSMVIAGFEQSTYSSLSLNTNPFVQVYLDAGKDTDIKIGSKDLYARGWGKVRLLGAPQPSTNGIGSTFTDPTGVITKQDFTKIGQSLDVVGGVAFFRTGLSPTGFGRSSWIVFVGTTTPVSSQDVAYMFKAPDAGTQECTELRSRFNPSTGYSPGLVADPTGKACLIAGTTTVKDIAFANQDRSSFLFKWGGGFRIEGTSGCANKPECLKALGMLDVSLGQDATVTKGMVRNFVAKADGVLPITFGSDSSYLYLYGSVYTRLLHNTNSSPLILAAENNKPNLPDPSVVILPLRQPDRDFFRIGIGLNLSQVFCKFASCSQPNSVR